MTIKIEAQPKELADFLATLPYVNQTVLTERMETLFNELEKYANSSCSAVYKDEFGNWLLNTALKK